MSGHRRRRRIAHVREQGIQDRAEVLGEIVKDRLEFAIEIGEHADRALVQGDEAAVVQRPHRVRRSIQLGGQRLQLVANGSAIGRDFMGKVRVR